jgi:hypothetical protein
MQPFHAFAEQLQLAQETELLKLDVIEKPMRLGQMQDKEQQSAINGHLVWFAHGVVRRTDGSGTIGFSKRVRQSLEETRYDASASGSRRRPVTTL